MMLTVRHFLIVCPLVFLAGFVDAIGGGGGLISLPAYLIAGLPSQMASATNKLSATLGTAVSTWRYVKNKCCDLPLAIPGIVMSFVGAQLGAKTALHLSSDVFEVLLLILLPALQPVQHIPGKSGF